MIEKVTHSSKNFMKKLHNVIIIGDLIIDRYISGVVDRISPESPVPVLDQIKDEYRLGGAANVAMNLKNLNCKITLVAMVGNDNTGTKAIQLLNEACIDTSFLVLDENRKTTLKTRVLAKNQQLLRIDYEDTHQMSSTRSDKVCQKLMDFIKTNEIDAILFQDYDKGMLSAAFINQIIEFAKQKQIPTFADPKKNNFLSFVGVDYFKPNLKEVTDQFKLEINPQYPEMSLLMSAAQKIRKAIKNHCSIITLGASGIFYEDEDGAYLHPTDAIDVVDVCGAGDTVISVLCKAIISGLALEKAIQLSNNCATLVCSRSGVCPIDLDSYNTFINQSKN